MIEEMHQARIGCHALRKAQSTHRTALLIAAPLSVEDRAQRLDILAMQWKRPGPERYVVDVDLGRDCAERLDLEPERTLDWNRLANRRP